MDKEPAQTAHTQSRPLRVAFDVAQTCSSREGCAWHAAALAKALHALSASTDLILYHQFGDWLNPHTDNGIILDGCAKPFTEMSCWDAKDLWTAIEAGHSSLPGDPDIVHSNSFLAPTTPENIPLVYTVHDLTFWTHPEYTSERNRIVCQGHLLKALKNADAFIFVSQTSREDFERVLPRWLETNKKPYRIIRSGSRFTAHTTTDKGHPTAESPWLYVGSIEPRKNIKGLIKCYRSYCSQTQHPRPLHLIGGAKWHAEPITALIDEASKSLPITYHGYLDDEILKKHFANAYALLFPSHYEGFGLPVIEAMSFGIPSICHDLPSLREFSEGAALFTDFTKSEIAAKSLTDLENDTALYKTLSEKGIALVKSQNWEKAAQETIDFYHEVLSTFKSPISNP